MTEKLKNNYYYHLESDQSDISTIMGKERERKPRTSASDSARTVPVLPSTYNTRSTRKNTTVNKQDKNVSSITTTTIPQGHSRLRSPSTGNDPQVQDKNTERESRAQSNVTDNQGYDTEMISLITRYFSNYLSKYPVNNHSAFIQKCFQNGLDKATDIASFKTSVNIMDNNRLLMMLQKSAALREYMIFSFGHNQKIEYELTQKVMEELDQKTPNHR
jgi:hypothetical protein